MIIHSDLHMHSEFSHDSHLTLKEIAEVADSIGLCEVGVTDHVNLNDALFLGNARKSAENVKGFQKTYPKMRLGVELTPIEKPQFEYLTKNKTSEGYVAPETPLPFEIELALSQDDIASLGFEYVIGAAHWRVDVPCAMNLPIDRDAMIKEWHRQQMYLACDKRIKILGHPWFNGHGVWYEDFKVIPRSMNMELAEALRENGKYVECNAGVILSPLATEKFRHQYAEFLRELFEMGIPVTFGSDAHNIYNPPIEMTEKYLIAAGFCDGDIASL